MTTHNYPGAILMSGLLIFAAQGASASPVTFTQYNNSSLFVDISATSTALNLGGDVSRSISTTIGNTIFGAGTVRVGNNGAIGRTNTTGSTLGFTNFALPSNDVFGGNVPALRPFWDDIGGTAGLYDSDIGGGLFIDPSQLHFRQLRGKTPVWR